MAFNWNITVGSPQLTQGMAFQVKYKKTTESTWTPLSPNPTANTFVIQNLDQEASYEAEIRTVCASGDLSSAVLISTAENSDDITLRWQTLGGSQDLEGSELSIAIKGLILTSTTNLITSQVWEVDNGSGWQFFADYTSAVIVVPIADNAVNRYRLKVTKTGGIVAYSNILQYTKKTANIVMFNGSAEKEDIVPRHTDYFFTFPLANFFTATQSGQYKVEVSASKTGDPNIYSVALGTNIGNTPLDQYSGADIIGDITTQNIQTAIIKSLAVGDKLTLYYRVLNIYKFTGTSKLSMTVKVTKL